MGTAQSPVGAACAPDCPRSHTRTRRPGGSTASCCCRQVLVVPQNDRQHGKCAKGLPNGFSSRDHDAVEGKQSQDACQAHGDQGVGAHHLKKPAKQNEAPAAIATAPSRPTSILQAIAAARLAKAGANQPPPALHKYLLVRLLITAGILAYSCYPLFTSNMMQLLACQPILGLHGGAGDVSCTVAGAQGAREAKANLLQTCGTMHYQWLQQRFKITDNPADNPALCHPGLGGDSDICQVCFDFTWGVCFLLCGRTYYPPVTTLSPLLAASFLHF